MTTGTAVTAVVTCDVDFHPVFQCHVWTQIRVHRTMINISVVFVQIKQIGRLKIKNKNILKYGLTPPHFEFSLSNCISDANFKLK